ncbi:MAG: tryptophan 7-halogenase [Gammaproteobacteria bacterium]|nr:tryptophan 7-halogenase [Gammaproteobacteria bacterium]MBV9621367.1 tryptophan 7-halogenase [Gammaproteobacteria bacterium]
MATATLFNYSYSPASGVPDGPAPRGLKHIAIVGGGTAGWMSALILARSFIGRGVQITLLESPIVGIIGVGEGSTPWLRGFFDSLGIEESEWMPACHATYKCGIRFEGWSTKPGYTSYFHPFASMLDNLTMRQFVHNVDSRINGADVYAHPDRFFIATRLANEHRAPKAGESFPFDVWHGYHFDAVLLGQFLQKKALERGVRYRVCHVTHANLAPDGAIASVSTQEGETIAADLFVDCSGFAGLLIDKALHTPFVSFGDNLFNDAAVALPTPLGEDIPCETLATALRHGWAWRIPLTNRFGNGYVYSSQFCSAEDAERELRTHLGVADDVPARHLKMRIGRVSQHWHKNCLAVGLSQGFIEPLEATALLFIQQTATTFAEFIERGDWGEEAHGRFNAMVNAHFEGIRDYIVTHYKTNTRADTEYWRANAANLNLSDELKQLYSLWMEGKSIAPPVGQQRLGRGYPVFSWYALMAGMGIFPEPQQLRRPTAQEARYDLAEIDNLLARSAGNYPAHRHALAAIAPRRREPALQIYFW